MSEDGKKKCPGCGDPNCPGSEAAEDVATMHRRLDILLGMAKTLMPGAEIVIVVKKGDIGCSASSAPRIAKRILESALAAFDCYEESKEKPAEPAIN